MAEIATSCGVTAMTIYRNIHTTPAVLAGWHAEPTTVEVVRLVFFDEQTRQIAERVHRGQAT